MVNLKSRFYWTLILLLLFSNILAQGAITVSSGKSRILEILNNTGINVNYGRATELTENNLKVRYEKTNMCTITVVKVNPFSSRIGTFIPSEFPCDFKAGSVYYQHFGSTSRNKETVKLQVRVDTEQETILKPVEFTVNIGLYEPFDILKHVENLVVDEVGGLSESFSDTIIGFRYDNSKQLCRVRFLPAHKGPPFYGSLVNVSDPDSFGHISNSNDISCAELLSGNLRYVHQRSRRTSNRDYLPFVVELHKKSTLSLQKREYIQIPVRIRRAPENQPPIVDYDGASYSLQVDQLVLTALTSSVIRVEDRETDAESIVFNITQVYGPGDGYLVHTDDSSVPVRTFYQRDVTELKIAYKPSGKLSSSQKMQSIYMEARDSYGAASPRFYIIILIKPMSSFAPRVVRNELLTMFEGQSRLISRDVLSIRDPDNEGDVIIRVSNGLRNGRLEMLGKSVTEITVPDINGKRVRYVHDGSDTASDNIVFHISDGKHDLEVLFVIMIVPKDDQPPQLTYNTGLTLDEGDTKMITQFQLSASDVDSDDTKTTYTILDAPSVGKIICRQSQKPKDYESGKQNWTMLNNYYERSAEEFTQVDIILGRIFYRHSGAEVFQDTFTFRLSDNADVPNQSGIKSFIITIDPIDDLSPEPYPGCTFTLDVARNRPGTFTKQSLRYTDGDSSDEEIRYTLLSQPYFEDTRNNAGNLYITRNGHSEVTDSFTQKHINHFKIKYVPHSNFNDNTTKVLFNFDVCDPPGNRRPNQTFTIRLNTAKNMPPSYETHVLSVMEKEFSPITIAHLNARDEDSDRDVLAFIIKKLPLYGSLTVNGIMQSVGSSISLTDIHEDSVVYLHSGGHGNNDVVKFVLTDQINMVALQLRISEFTYIIFKLLGSLTAG